MIFNENERNKIIQTTGLNNKKPIILVFGGSQGAKRINDTLVEIIKTKLNKDYQVIIILTFVCSSLKMK